ncbi:MAG: hypothetical protein EXR99_12840 [Gemmataceae bacterium]|nr:hypothetical protein [Gemmataceae bacterium]
MYSVVLLVAMSGSADVPELGNLRGCQGATVRHSCNGGKKLLSHGCKGGIKHSCKGGDLLSKLKGLRGCHGCKGGSSCKGGEKKAEPKKEEPKKEEKKKA